MKRYEAPNGRKEKEELFSELEGKHWMETTTSKGAYMVGISSDADRVLALDCSAGEMFEVNMNELLRLFIEHRNKPAELAADE